jgi:outer membrane biosynthesis protein TonB
MWKQYWVRFFLLVLVGTPAALSLSSLAQQVRSDGKRKLVVDIRPVYPPLARTLNLRGTVRLRVTVSPGGDPLHTEELGGSPVLVKAASNAVSKAKWEPAQLESKEIIEIKFLPTQE